MAGRGYSIFDTSIGRCGIAWGYAGIVGVQLPEAREIETRKRANQIVKDFVATQKNVVWVNFFDPFLGADGKPREELFIEDHMHPSHAGYELRAKILRPILGAPDRKPSAGGN